MQKQGVETYNAEISAGDTIVDDPTMPKALERRFKLRPVEYEAAFSRDGTSNTSTYISQLIIWCTTAICSIFLV